MLWPFTVWINCTSDFKNFGNFSWSLEQFFLAVGQNNFGNKVPLFSNFIIVTECANVELLNNGKCDESIINDESCNFDGNDCQAELYFKAKCKQLTGYSFSEDLFFVCSK